MSDQDEKEHPLKGMVTKVAGKEVAQQSSFPVAVVIACVTVIGFALMGLLIMRAKRKAARLAFKLRRREEDQAKALENLHLAKNAETRAAVQKKIEATETDILMIKTEIGRLKVANANRRKVIADLASWDDFVIVDKREDR